MNHLDSLPSSELGLLLETGRALSAEKDLDALMEQILTTAMTLSHADGGTLYRCTEDQQLAFTILRNRSLNIHMGGKSGIDVTIPSLPLFINGNADHSRVVCHAIHRGKTIHVEDVYSANDFDFSGTRQSDAQLGYRSQSILTVPLKNHESEIIGVLQLINAKDADSNAIVPFSQTAILIVEALASQAAVSLTNRILIDQLTHLFESFIGLVNHAIDDKSPYTSGHCGRVPELTLMMADAVNACDVGPLKNFCMTDADRYELQIAGLLHDCGKITTPVHVVDKATKLETIFDRIALLNQRAEIIIRDLDIKCLKGEIDTCQAQEIKAQLHDDCAFLKRANKGAEFMAPGDVKRIYDIAERYPWVDQLGARQSFLNEDEISNLTIEAGTLTSEERQTINRHIEVTISMLEKLPWPKHLRNVIEYASAHHERMDGKGYPRGLTREQMSIPARCMAIADVFEALTATDRPYKSAKTLNETLQIMGRMRLDHHLDPDLFDIFVWAGVYEQYAQRYFEPNQIDQVDVTLIPGYNPQPSATERSS